VYTYIYDSFVTDRAHERLLARIETRLTDLGISGRIERLTMFKDIGEIVADAARRGSETVVAVGNDETVSKLVTAVADLDVALGIIPIGEGPHTIAEMLGVLPEDEACNILSRRVLQRIDLGKINDHYFISSVEIPKTRASFACNDSYKVIPTQENRVSVCNLAPMSVSEDGTQSISSPHDGYLETVFRPSSSGGFFSRLWRSQAPPPAETVVPIRHMTIKHQTPFTVFRDGHKLSSSSIRIEIVPKKLKVITGKGRKFN
jgi:diacylglycerol kinase family enzyme